MYSEQLSSSKPGLIVILIDQSGSMSNDYSGGTKAEFAALAVNRVIAEIISACQSGDEIKDRCQVAVIGYGDKGVSPIFLQKASELAKNTNYITLKRKIHDGAGGIIEVDDKMRIFVNPIAAGGTPMDSAFAEAHQGASIFIGNYPDSFPPIVINITDGEPNDFDKALTEAKKLAELKTTDGNVIFMNAHISNSSSGKVVLPSNNEGISTDKTADFLFSISTILPDTLAQKAKDIGFNVQQNARGFVYNADAETLVRLLNFGSLGALR